MKRIIISTTPTIQGVEIIEYLDVITANIVAGTGLFADLFAGMSDIFGGRSNTYQQQIDSIKNEVISVLIEKARTINADAVIGVQFDFGEISGKGKQMLMVSCSGTAVKLSQTNKISNTPIAKSISMDEFNYLSRLKNIEKRIIQSQNVLHKDLEFLIQNKSSGLFEKLLDFYITEHKQISDDKKELLHQYFNSIHKTECEQVCINQILKSKYIPQIVFEILKENMIANYDFIISLLDSKAYQLQRESLTLLKINKYQYEVEDIEKLEKIKNKIQLVFKDRSEKITSVKKISKKEIIEWKCGFCKNMNSEEKLICSECSRDKMGFKSSELKPKQALEIIEYTLSILKEYFEQN